MAKKIHYYLISQESNMIIGESLSADNVVQIGAHQMGDKVQFVKTIKSLVRGENVDH